MSELRVARRYAKSLLGLAQEQQLLERIYADNELIESVIRSNRELAAVLKNPIIQGYKKEAVLKNIFGGKVHDATMNFLLLMSRKGRLSVVDEIADEYIAMYKEMQGIRTAHVTTAVPLDAASRERMLQIVRASLGQKALLEEHVNPRIIGGFVLRVKDTQYDSSVARQLSLIRRQLVSPSAKPVI